jgi:ABC-type transport system involved in multi-copper enzyme maturation permease subunit
MTATTKPSAQSNFFSRMLDNPIITKELKGRMRGFKGFITITAYISLISFFIGLIYLFIVADNGIPSNDPSLLQTIGKIIFSTVVLLELLMLGFIGPALTAGAISSEREHKTIDLLRTSLLSPPALVFGKLSSAVVFLLLLIVTAIPVQSLAFFLGGVGLPEMIISTLMLVITAIFFCTLGLFVSSFSKRTLISTVISYASILLSFVIFIIFLSFIGILGTSNSFMPSFFREIANVAMWFLFSTNPFFAAIASEMILIDDQSLFFTTNNVFGSSPLLPLPSPWIIYVIFYIFLTIVMICFSIFFVSRPDK